MGDKHPFRYRSYYYDTDTGWYYLQSRYYNPVWGRFINADATSVLLAIPHGLTDKNLFAYCDNNTITRIDEDGEFWLTAIVVGAAAGAISAIAGQIISDVVTSVLSGELYYSSWQTYAGAALGGAAGGAILAATGSSILANTASSLVTTGTTMALETISGEASHTVEDFGKTMVENLIIDTTVDRFIGDFSMANVTSGRNSYAAVFNSGLTKLKNGTATRMSGKTFAKGVWANTISSLGDNLSDGLLTHLNAVRAFF